PKPSLFPYTTLFRSRDPQPRGRKRAARPMTPGVKVSVPGLHTTVQDLGRVGYQNIGVPISGALDGFALRLANALVGNPQGMAARSEEHTSELQSLAY